MRVNPMLKALDLSDTDRAVLIHTDDIGMCHAALAAYADLAADGVISAGSVMVPCPWFQATAQFCAAHPEMVDMGVHITLNAEWESGYRWGPVSTRDPASGLLDDEGYMHRTVAAVQAQAQPEAVRREIAAQVQWALDAGIDVTHIDTHMGTVLYAPFIEGYLAAALAARVPPFVVGHEALALRAMGFPQEVIENLGRQIAALEAQGVPVFDEITTVPFTGREAHLAQAKAALRALKPGLTYLIIHPSQDTPELRAILPDGWQARVADYETFMRQEELRTFLADEGIQVLSWRTLRDTMRAQM